MKNMVFLLFIIPNLVFGGTHGSSPDEKWLLIVPAVLLTIILLFPIVKKNVRQMLTKYKEKKQQQLICNKHKDSDLMDKVVFCG